MSRLLGWARWLLTAAPQSTRPRLHTLRFRRLADNLRALVELCDDATQKLGGQWVLDRRYVASFGQRALELGRAIVFDTSVASGDGSPDLYARLDGVRRRLDDVLVGRAPAAATDPLLVPMRDNESGPWRREPVARLAELERHLGIPPAGGFVITATARDIERGALGEVLVREDLRSRIAEASVALGGAFALYAPPAGQDVRVPVRYGVPPDRVAEAYAAVLAEWLLRGPAPVGEMAVPWPSVACVAEDAAQSQGFLLTSDPDRPLSLRLEVVGREGETHVVPRHPGGDADEGVPEPLAPLPRLALTIERFLGRPQMAVWTRTGLGLAVAQSWDLAPPAGPRLTGPRLAVALRRHEAVHRDASAVAVAGFAAGRVRRLPGPPAEEKRPCVWVLDSSHERMSHEQLRGAAAVLVAAERAEDSWLALARDLRVPVLLGLGKDAERFEEAEAVTVDAEEGIVYRGLVEELVLYHLAEPSCCQAEPEYQLLRESIRRVMPPPASPDAGGADAPPTLADVVRAAHERSLQSLDLLHSGAWGRRAGLALRGLAFAGSIRVVDAGGGTAPGGGETWWSGLGWDRVRSAPLRALLGPSQPILQGPMPVPPEPRPAAVAVVTEERATVHIRWGGRGRLLVDACLGRHAPANAIYCALRGTPLGSAAPLEEAVLAAGFRRFDVGLGLTCWLHGRGLGVTRRALEGVGRSLGALLGDHQANGGRTSSASDLPR